MMWWLVSLQNQDVRYGLLCNKQYSVGRKEGDITVPADQSMSRKHAILLPTHTPANISHIHKLPELKLQDVSKLGTMLQGQRFKAETRVVSNGDEILFGTGGESNFRVEYDPSIMTTSCLDTASKRNIRPVICELGGHLVSEWRRDCSILLMSSLSVTVKVICALISQKPIVTPAYLDDMLTAIKTQSTPPDASRYIPPLAESQLNPEEVSFQQNPSRKTVFQGKIFIFLSTKQFKKLCMAVELAGGTPMLMEEGSEDGDDLIVASHTCVMQCVAETTMSKYAIDWLHHITELLKKHNRRMVQDCELGFAVLYASTEKYCNPASDSVLDRASAPSESISQAAVQSERPVITKLETCSQNPDTPSRKRMRNNDSTTESLAKSRRVLPGSVIEIKPEPSTPQQTLEKDNVVSRMHAVKRSPSPAPESCHSTRGNSPAPKKDGRQTKTVASVKPTTEQIPSTSVQDQSSVIPTFSKKTANKVEVELDDFDFDSVPTRRRGRRGAERSINIKVEAVKEDVVSRKGSRENDTVEEIVDDELDNVPSRRRRRGQVLNEPQNNKETRKRIREQEERVFEDIDEFDSKKERETYDDDVEVLEEKRKKKRRKEEEEDNYKKEDAVVDEFDMVPSRKRGGWRKENRQEKVLKTTPTASKNDIYSNSLNQSKPPPPRTIAVCSRLIEDSGIDSGDFLNTVMAIGDQVKKDPDYMVDTDLKDGRTVVEEASLVVRQPGNRTHKNNTHLVNGECMWNGRKVKNFKMFKKPSRQLTRLPCIIGGSDLIVHENKARPELDEWFQQSQQAESQKQEVDNNMFDWNPPKKRAKKR